MNSHRACKFILSKNVIALSSEMIHFSVKSSVVMLTPGHAITGLFNWYIFLGKHTGNVTNTLWINRTNIWDARWKSVTWTPLTVFTWIVSWQGFFVYLRMKQIDKTILYREVCHKTFFSHTDNSVRTVCSVWSAAKCRTLFWHFSFFRHKYFGNLMILNNVKFNFHV